MKAASCLGLVVLAAALVPVVVACSDDGDPDLVVQMPPDAGPPSTLPDAAEPIDSGIPVDAADASDVTVPKRTCTEEGWCHTPVSDDQIFRDVWGDGQGTVWMVSEQGNILRWDGTAWVQSHAAGAPLYAVWGSGPTDLWVGGEGGLLHGTGPSASAITWAPVTTASPVMSIWGVSATDIWAVGHVSIPMSDFESGRVLHYAGPGTEWAVDPVSTAQPARYAKVWGTSTNDVWIGGDSDWSNARALHRTSDGAGGFTWSAGTQPSEGMFKGGGSITPSNVFLLGFGPPETYFTGESSDNGATFSWTWHDGFKTGYALNAVWGTGPNDIWLAGIFGRLRHFDGTKWRVASIALDNILPIIRDFYAIWGTGPDDVWAVGQGIALHKGPPKRP